MLQKVEFETVFLPGWEEGLFTSKIIRGKRRFCFRRGKKIGVRGYPRAQKKALYLLL